MLDDRGAALSEQRAQAPMAAPPGATFDYDVAISYAREDLAHAEVLATVLERAGVRVFYDRHAEAELWGEELRDRLGEVYLETARFVVILASRHYATRPWTIFELNAARRRMARDWGQVSVLPIAIGRKTIPELPEAIAHIELGESIERAATLLLTKLQPSVDAREHVLALPTEHPRRMNPMVSRYQAHNPPQMVAQPTTHTTRQRGNNFTTAGNNNKISHGLGGVAITTIILVMGTIVVTMGWLAVDFVKHAPRNSEGGVTVWGFDIPAALVGKKPVDGPLAGTEPPAPPLDEPKVVLPSEPKADIGAPSPDKLAGIWVCGRDSGRRGDPAIIMFTANRRAGIKHPWNSSTKYEGVFQTWNDAPYTFIEARTMKVGDTEAHVELAEDGASILVIGSGYHFDCVREGA